MDGFLFGLACICAAVATWGILLRPRARKIAAADQAFRLHSLRDELQILVAEGRLEPSSPTHDFLMTMLNFAIRNAGSVKLREVLQIARNVKDHIGKTQFEDLLADVERHDGAVQELFQRFFLTFGNMLVSNDWIVRTGVRTVSAISTSWRAFGPAVRALDKGASIFVGLLTPTKGQAVREARWYFERAKRLNPAPNAAR